MKIPCFLETYTKMFRSKGASCLKVTLKQFRKNKIVCVSVCLCVCVDREMEEGNRERMRLGGERREKKERKKKANK